MGIAYNTSIVRNGLILHLDAANSKSYPGSGTVWSDLSGNANNSALMNDVGYNVDNKGSLTFDGTNDWIDCGNATIFSPQYITASVIVYCNSFSARPHLFGRGDGGSGNFYMVVETNATFRFYNDIGSGWAVSAQTSAFPLNTWTYVTCTHDGTTSRIYYNGVEQVNGSRVGTLRNWQSNTLQIGNIANSNQLINGKLSVANLYNRALSATEIRQNFEATRGRYGI